MRAVVQRVARAKVVVAGEVVGEVGRGYLVLLGVGREDDERACRWLARKIVELRVFEDENGRMNRALAEVEGAVLVVSQFTLFAGLRRGRRPDFLAAADPADAERLYERFVEEVRAAGIPVQTGRFGADMQVELLNDGPATFYYDTESLLAEDSSGAPR